MEIYKVTVDNYGTRRWYSEDGELHRSNGPAVEHANGHAAWFINGKRHRVDGPAVQRPSGHTAWYLNGIKLSEIEFIEATKPASKPTIDSALKRLEQLEQLDKLLNAKIQFLQGKDCYYEN